MKKILILLLTIASFLVIVNIKYDALASDNEPGIKEGFHSIAFKNLNSKNINELFKDLNGTVIEIEVETKYFTKSYKMNTRLTYNIEEEITNKVIKDLNEMNEREGATYYLLKGFKINKVDLICTEDVKEKIIEREKDLYN